MFNTTAPAARASNSTPESRSVASRSPRRIEGVYSAPPLHWVGDGFRVAGYFSAIPDAARKLDPFLMLDYHPEYHYPASPTPRGVGVHPHRGFETVTIAFQGRVAHHDSAGGGGVIGPGDVQWMTAGSGVLHKEYHENEFSRQGGAFQMAQLWVNLPREHKMTAPRYQAILSRDVGVRDLPDGLGTVRVIAGSYDGAVGPAHTFTPINIYEARLLPGGVADFVFPPGHHTAMLIMEGEVTFNGNTQAVTHDFVLFHDEGDLISVRANGGARVLVLDGQPIDEPVVQYGPFVMNTASEIRQAMLDLNAGKFGYLAD